MPFEFEMDNRVIRRLRVGRIYAQQLLKKKLPTPWYKEPTTDGAVRITQLLSKIMMKVKKGLEAKYGDEGVKIYDDATAEVVEEFFREVKKDLNLGDTAADAALANFFWDVYMWGLQERIVEAGEDRAVVEIKYCPCASKFGGPFEVGPDCRTWRAMCQAIADGATNKKVWFKEAPTKLTQGEAVCTFVFEKKK